MARKHLYGGKSMDNQQVNWANVGLRMVQGLTTVIDAIRQLDAQEASLVMKLLGKTCMRTMKEGVGHQFGIALVETSAQLAMSEKLVVEDVLKIISSIIGRLYFTASSEEEKLLVAQLEDAVKNYQII
ncbi:hypothetical protein HMPREF0322_02287 [Desulfitobacterium hafniense DP7]|uniref:Recombinase n=5 Tax=root TaxID=1 RepID=G9XMU9_DESHA|nr:hypothetical protein HMPREF0322_02287 [Desulfitobacterium hafniense DP7]